MTKDEKREVEKVTRDYSPPPLPIPGMDGTFETKITDNRGNKYTGYGLTRKEADRDAGEKYNDHDSDSKSSSPCFISTACIEARGLPDNCLELQVLRRFRDTFVRGLPEGANLIRGYYTIAPAIVQGINSRPDRSIIYADLFRRLVDRSVALIQQGRDREAFETYRRMVERIETDWL